jgi:hypothetical protein
MSEKSPTVRTAAQMKTPGRQAFAGRALPSVGAAPLPAFPASAQAPLRSLCVRPADAAYLAAARRSGAKVKSFGKSL